MSGHHRWPATLARVYDGFAYAIMVAALLVAAWCFVAAARDTWIGRTHLTGLVFVETAVLVQDAVALVRIGGESGPSSS